MYELNLGLENTQLYKGCEIRGFEGKLRLDTPLDSACVIVASNIRSIVERISENDRDSLILTGQPPQQQILITIVANATPFFKEVKHFDGRKRVWTKIPTL